jgi:hypothetical protein
MAYPTEDKLEVYRAAQTGLIRLEPDPEKKRKYIDFIDCYANLTDEEVMRYREQYLNGQGDIMGFAQLLRDEGRQEGRQEGQCHILLRLLTRRFGILPQWARRRLENATPEQLEIWADQLLDAETLEKALEV